jgi:hypothetical protein
LPLHKKGWLLRRGDCILNALNTKRPATARRIKTNNAHRRRKMTKVIALSSVLIFVVFSYGMAIGASPSSSVTVINTSSNPVPVTGNVGITNTPNVNISNQTPIPVTGTLTPSGTQKREYSKYINTSNRDRHTDGAAFCRSVHKYLGQSCQYHSS